MSIHTTNDYSDAPWNQSHPEHPKDKSPKLRRASHNFKHGLYSQSLAFSTPSEHDFYGNILHDFVEEYRPIGPSECGLVQQLASLQFRFQKIQTLYADYLREEVYRQAKNAALDAATGALPSETTIESRAYVALSNQPAFQLFTRELDRLPTRIQRVMRRLYETIKLRHEAANWPDLPITEIENKPVEPSPSPMEITQGEAAAKTKDSNPEAEDPMAPWRPEPILTKEKFWQVWPTLKPYTQEVLLDTSDPKDYRRLGFFRWTKLDENNFWQWLHEGPPATAGPELAITEQAVTEQAITEPRPQGSDQNHNP